MLITHVALVGHCGFDSGLLGRFANALVPGAEVVRVNDQDRLNDLSDASTLLLVNRVLDGRFDAGGSGIDLIRSVIGAEQPPLAVLVSNYQDAQLEAVQAGALPGFGKSQIGDPKISQRLADAIADARTSAPDQ